MTESKKDKCYYCGFEQKNIIYCLYLKEYKENIYCYNCIRKVLSNEKDQERFNKNHYNLVNFPDEPRCCVCGDLDKNCKCFI